MPFWTLHMQNRFHKTCMTTWIWHVLYDCVIIWEIISDQNRAILLNFPLFHTSYVIYEDIIYFIPYFIILEPHRFRFTAVFGNQKIPAFVLGSFFYFSMWIFRIETGTWSPSNLSLLLVSYGIGQSYFFTGIWYFMINITAIGIPLTTARDVKPGIPRMTSASRSMILYIKAIA